MTNSREVPNAAPEVPTHCVKGHPAEVERALYSACGPWHADGRFWPDERDAQRWRRVEAARLLSEAARGQAWAVERLAALGVVERGALALLDGEAAA